MRRVILVGVVHRDARRRYHWQKRTFHRDALERVAKVVHVALHDGLANVAQRPDAHMSLRAEAAHAGGLEEVRIARFVAPEKADLRLRYWPDLVAVQPLHHI